MTLRAPFPLGTAPFKKSPGCRPVRGFPRPLIRVLTTETALRKLGQVGHLIGNSLTSEATPKGPERIFTSGKGYTHPAKDCTHPLETSYNGLISAFTLANDLISRHSTNCLSPD